MSISLTERLRSLAFRTLRLGFRLAPMPTATRDRLRQRFLERHANLVPAGPSGIAAIGSSIRAYDHAAHRLLGYVPARPGLLPEPLPATLIAFYLPQFHPFPENDAWWGRGFTEWRNVTRALPQFEGHLQPRLPGDLGYYDLRVADVMREQMALARDYGIGAFCTYFYWFAGKTLMEAPLRQWLEDPAMDLPICLCWANENWSRRWDGRADDVLIGQQHSETDDLAFIAHISEYLKDARYVRVEGKPLILVYRPGLLPDARATADRWRRWCMANDIGEIHLVYVQSFDNVDPSTIGFDAAVAFPPNNTTLRPVTHTKRLINAAFAGQVFDWRDLAASAQGVDDPPYRLYPCVNPGWDNEARRPGRGRSFVHATPRAFGRWTRHAVATARRRTPGGPLVFVNAWNEWAEGAVLEPDARYGYAWLEAIRSSMSAEPPRRGRPCVVIHVWYVELLEELLSSVKRTGVDFRVVLTVPEEKEHAVRNELVRIGMDVEIVVGPNRGRDILPFLRVARQLLDEGEDIVLKLHTKMSKHRDDGAIWRAELLDRLLTPVRAQTIVETFNARSEIGLIAPEGHVQPLTFYWGANAANVEYLCSLTGIGPPSASADAFVAGSMFWCRLTALETLIDAPLSEADFAAESGQVDGTMAHAVERVVALTAIHAGFQLTTAAAIVGEPEPDGAYAYARRG